MVRRQSKNKIMNEYPVYPEQQGDEDYKLNPYAPV